MTLTTLDAAALIKSHQLILYDGTCPLCVGFVRFVLKRDRDARFRFVAMQSGLGQEILARYDQPLRDWESNLLIAQGRSHEKSSAFLGVCRALPRPWSWLAWLEAVPLGARDWLYDRIARNRYALFARSSFCALPSPETAWRFLS